MHLNLSRGPAAEVLLRDPSFLAQWHSLYSACSWGTVMQTPEFVTAWYAAYSARYDLVLLHSGSDGTLHGLLPLAADRQTGAIVAAGGHHAEYQTWLARDADTADAFFGSAVERLERAFPGRVLHLLFLAPNTPLGWRHGRAARQTELRTFSRPLLHIGDGATIRESLRKRHNKLKLKKLGQGHPLSLVRLDTADALEEIFDEVVALATLRLSGFYGEPATADPLKKPFYRALMNVPGLVHATLLMAGGAIVSAQLNLRNRREMLWGFAAYAPSFAKYSPSYVHLLLLGEQLALDDGIDTFDLTPGGAYKDRFATHHDTAHALTVCLGTRALLTFRAQRAMRSGAKAVLARLGVDRSRTDEVRDRARHKWRHTRVSAIPSKLLRMAARRLSDSRELRLYSMDVSAIRSLPRPMIMACNSVEDVMRYEPHEAWQPSQAQFHRDTALAMEAGARFYSCVENDRLLHFGWLIPRQECCNLSEVDHLFEPPPDCAVLSGFYTSPTARGRGLYRASLQQMLHDAADIPGTERVYIGVLADNIPSRRVIESLGFAHEASFHRTVRFGKARKWREDISVPRARAEQEFRTRVRDEEAK